jgi:hypothetical protein
MTYDNYLYLTLPKFRCEWICCYLFWMAGPLLPTPMYLAGSSAPAVHVSMPSPPKAFIIHLKDSQKHIYYIVDSATALSLVPHRSGLNRQAQLLLTPIVD